MWNCNIKYFSLKFDIAGKKYPIKINTYLTFFADKKYFQGKLCLAKCAYF